MRTVCIESPLSGDTERNRRYALACLRFCLNQGVAPFASHLLYTQVLDDQDVDHRSIGMNAGFTIGDKCDERWVFIDEGVSSGMREGMKRADRVGQPYRTIQLGDWEAVHIEPTENFE